MHAAMVHLHAILPKTKKKHIGTPMQIPVRTNEDKYRDKNKTDISSGLLARTRCSLKLFTSDNKNRPFRMLTAGFGLDVFPGAESKP